MTHWYALLPPTLDVAMLILDHVPLCELSKVDADETNELYGVSGKVYRWVPCGEA